MTHELQQAETSQEATTRQNTLQTTGACTHCLVFSCEEVHDVKRVQYPHQDDLAWKSWSLGLQSSPPFSMLKVDIPSPTVSGRRRDKAVVLPLTGNNHWNLPKSFSFQSKHILMCLFVSCFFIIIIIYFGWPFKVAQHSLFEGGFGRHDWHRCCLVIIMFFLVAVPNWSTQLEEALLYSPQWDI